MKQLSKSWEEFFAELEQYKLKFGEVNQITQKKRQRLREWCEEQRVQAARRKWGKYSQITDDQIERLSQLGFKWDTVDSPSKGWDDYYGELLIHFLNTRSWSIPNNLGNLGQWIDQQRTEYKKFLRGVPSLLTSGQIKKLDSVHFPWLTNRDSKLPSKSWEEMFGELLADKVKHGRNRSNDSKNVELYNWKVRQRQDRMNIEKKYKKRSAVFEERIRKLDEVGFDWNGPKVQLTKGGARRRMPLQESATGASAMTPVAPMPMGGPAFVGPWTGHGPFVRPVGIPIVPVPKGHQAIIPTQPAGQMVGQAAAAAAFVVAQNPKDLANQAAKVVADLNARNKETPEEGHETASDQKIQAALNE